ncbi:cytochrome c oxidase assembly protein [Pelistega sp. NLN82]|uniref:Cytochrome c oxidase assembly protein n=1 Tax=Pelistega ratti TaxID=2652177 RepID=A0A6L9Y8V0_9BURK|nr:cytochrome c oxidase assembly protein [Pelistega ratti]NEN76307.1 cytochrome c oxidase assembly protein [Pelistega ratti]
MDLTLAQWLTPWEFSPTLMICFIVSAYLFIKGTLTRHVSFTRQLLFWSGWVMLYLSLHTHVDYFAERVFFVHRTQHIFLHHLAPLLVMAAYPGQVMRAGMPRSWRVALRRFLASRVGQIIERICTDKYFVPFLFVFLVLVWLIPTVQFYSMLDIYLYRLMNWSVVVSGFMYWNLVLDRRPSKPAAMSPRGRILSPIFTMIPQIIAGIYIALAPNDLYPLFDLCGRALPISASKDQTFGGIIMWVPAAIVESFGILVALSNWMRLAAKGRLAKR